MRTLRYALIAAGLAVAALAPTALPAGAQGADCDVQDAGGQCVGNNNNDNPGTGGTGAASRGPLTCKWLAFEDQAYGHSLFPDAAIHIAHDGGNIVYQDCGRPQGNGRYDPWERVGAVGTLTGGTTNLGLVQRPYPWRAPAEIARDLWAEVVVTLPPPDPVVSPPLSEAAIIDQPTFVAVQNWPGVISPEPECDGPVCIQLTAVPTLVFDPGDGSDPITCEGRGSFFDPAGPEPAVQAEGACAHIYDRRTTGEPFPGSVAIQWQVTWTSQTPDDDGVIDVIPQGVPVPRQVDEVQGVVVDTGEGAG